ncbi:MAG: aminotransferase class III-fold pyridoxal phosphate-dependent enzyme, partial [Bryobacteraceae bacterium]
GLMLGLQLDISGKQFVLDGIEQGLLFNCTHDTVLRFLPPYIVTEKEADRAISILKRILKKA